MDPGKLGKHHSEEEEGDLVSAAEVKFEQETSNWPIEISRNADEQNPKTSIDLAQEEEEEEEKEEVHHEDEPKSIVKRFAPWWVPRSKEHWFLTVLSLLESTNHISTLLFVAASYQRVLLEEHSSTCSGGDHLQPILPADCPEELLIGRLPSCNWELHDLTLCEADYEYDTRCPLTEDVNNCGVQDVYQVQNEPKCAHYSLECGTIMKLIWAISFTSLWGTMMSVGTFHASRFWGSLRKIPWYIKLLGALMMILLILGFVVGLGSGSGTSMLMMVCICAFFPALLWVLMTHIKLEYQSRTTNSLERAQAAAAAMLELPGYNVLFAKNLEAYEADSLFGHRKPLDVILRLVEDLPEVCLGIADEVLFGGSWFAMLSLTLSFAMVIVALFMGTFQCLNASAVQMAKDIGAKKLAAAKNVARRVSAPRLLSPSPHLPGPSTLGEQQAPQDVSDNGEIPSPFAEANSSLKQELAVAVPETTDKEKREEGKFQTEQVQPEPSPHRNSPSLMSVRAHVQQQMSKLPPGDVSHAQKQMPQLPPGVGTHAQQQMPQLPPGVGTHAQQQMPQLPPGVGAHAQQQTSQLPPGVGAHAQQQKSQLPPGVGAHAQQQMPQLPPGVGAHAQQQTSQLPPGVGAHAQQQKSQLPPGVGAHAQQQKSQLPPGVGAHAQQQMPQLPPGVGPHARQQMPQLPPGVGPHAQQQMPQLPPGVGPHAQRQMPQLPPGVGPRAQQQTSHLAQGFGRTRANR